MTLKLVPEHKWSPLTDVKGSPFGLRHTHCTNPGCYLRLVLPPGEPPPAGLRWLRLVTAPAIASPSSIIEGMRSESKRLLIEAAERYVAQLACGYPGCDRRLAPRNGKRGRPPGFCDLPEHNAQTAFSARQRDGMAPDTNRAARAERDAVIRRVYASELAAGHGVQRREIAGIFGLDEGRVGQIITLVCPECGSTLACSSLEDKGRERWTCPEGHGAADPAGAPR